MKKTLTKVISVCIILTMLMSQFSMFSSAVNTGESYPVITAGETKTVKIENGGDYYYFSFTPETDGVYIFKSNSSDDTYGYLYDADGNEITSNDDGGENRNFSIAYQLEAGKGYVYGCRYYNSDMTGLFDVTLSESNVASITAVATMQLIENYDGYDNGDYFYYSIDNCNPEYTVTLKDGTTRTGKAWEIEEAFGYRPEISAEQSAENPLGIGKHTAEVSILGVKGTCEFEIIENPVASITAVATKQLIEDYDGYDNGGYFYYEISNCNPEYTVTFKDGTTRTGKDWQIEEKIGYWPDINVWQSAENPLGIGKHTAEVSILGVKGTCEFEIIENPVASIAAVATKQLIENYGGYDNGGYFYYDISNCDPEYTVTFKDGTNYTGTNWEIEEKLGYRPEISAEQSAENELGIGKHTAEVSVLGVKGTCEFEIVDNPVAGVTAVATRQLMENYDGYYNGDYFDYYIGNCAPEYTVTFKDGTDYTGTEWEIEEKIGYWPGISAEQSAENPLEIGKHTAEVSVLGVKGTCEFEIIENPVASITAVATRQLMENYDGYYNGDYFGYYISHCNPKYTVTLKDGTTRTGKAWEIEEAFGYRPEISAEQSAENPLGIGKHTAEVSILGVKGTCEFEIVDTPVASIKVDAEPLRFGIDKSDDNAKITITYKNGEVYTGTLYEIDDLTGYYDISIDWNAESQKIGTNTGYITFLNKEYPFEYQVIENPYTSLEIISVEPMEQSNHYGEPDFDYKLIKKDGTIEVRHYVYGSSDYPPTWDSEIPVSVQPIGEWGPNKANKFNVTAAGLTAEGSVKITPKSLYYSYILLDNSNVIITGVHNSAETLTIPEKIDGYTVVGVSKLGYAAASAKKIILPDSVKFLSLKWAYYDDSAVEEIVIGKGVQKLDYEMFKNLSKLKSITVSKDNPVYTTLNGAVYTKDMSTLVAYPCGGAKNYVIPAKTSNIDILGDVVYDNINISYSKNTKDYAVKDGVTYSADMKKIIFCNTTKSGSYVMPATVETVNTRAFAGCNKLSSITVSEKVTDIVYGTFADCTALKSISIPKNVKSIEKVAFGNCTSLSTVKFSENLSVIGSRAFTNCTSLKTVTLPQKLKTVEDYAFEGCTGITEFTISNSVTEFSWYALDGCTALKTLNIGDGISTGAEDLGYSYKSLTDINVSAGNKVYSSINGVVYSKDKTELIKYPYARTAKSFTIPNGVKTVGDSAFDYCSSLENITFPDSLENANYDAFYSTAWYQNKTGFVNGVLYAGKCLLKADADVIKGSYTVKPGTVSIGDGAFNYCTSLTSVTIPNSVTSIGWSAFGGCTSLTSVTIPDSVTSIGGDAFYGCTALTNITIPDSVTSIGRRAFYGCPIEAVKLPKNLKTIGYRAFSETKLTSIEIPDTVTDMVYGFCDTDISEIKMPDTLVSMECDFNDTPWYDSQPEGQIYLGRMLYSYKGWIPNYSDITVKNGTLGISGYAFSYQSNLKNIILPEGLQEIGTGAFANCISLQSPDLPSTLKTIKGNAFKNCKSIDVINIPASVTEINISAFDGCSKLKAINVAANNPVYSSVDGVLYSKDKTELIYCPVGKTGKLVLPKQTKRITWRASSAYPWGNDNHSLSSVVINNDNIEGYENLYGIKCWYGAAGSKAEKVAKTYRNIVFIPLTLSAPTLSKITNSAMGVTVTWSKISGATSYNVYRKAGNATSWTKVASVTGTAYTDSKVSSGTKYTYTVRAVNGSGMSGFDANGISILRLAQPTFKVDNQNGYVRVAWNKVAGATGYYVYRKAPNAKSWTRIATVTGTAYADKSVKSGSNYVYTVRAFNGNVSSSYHSGVAIKYLARPTFKVDNQNGYVRVAWNKVAGATGYYVYRKAPNAKSWTRIATVSGTAYNDKNVKSGSNYVYTVRAFNGKFTSTFHSGLAIKYLARPTFKVANKSNNVTVSWSKVAGAKGYYVYRKAGNATSWTRVATVTGTSYNDKNVKKNVKYTYTVKAYNGKYTSTYHSGAGVKH